MESPRKPTARDYASLFVPSLHMPTSAFPSFIGAATILFVCIYTTTLRPSPVLVLLRMFLSVPAIFLLLDFANNPSYEPKGNNGANMGMGLMCVYGIMRVLDCCWIPLVDRDEDKVEATPRWVKKEDLIKFKTRQVEKGRSGVMKSQETVARSPRHMPTLPIPSTVKGRLMYSFDLLTSIRGSSWYGDRVWNWAPLAAATYTPPTGRAAFIKMQMSRLVLHYVTLDIQDTFNKSIRWNTMIENPVSTAPLHIQLLASLSVFTGTILYITIQVSILSSQLVLAGSDPKSWFPMFDSPFYAKSLSELWTFRWHHILRRVFGRMSQGVLAIILPSSFQSQYPRATQVMRRAVIFACSAWVHLYIMNLIPIDATHPHKFYNVPTLKFFLSQPLGLMLESWVVWPATEFLPDGWLKESLRRVFAWAWLLWTGRWWSDVWVARGCFDQNQKPLIWSPVRGLLRGQWAA